MAKPLSEYLRIRVVQAVEDGMSRRAAAERAATRAHHLSDQITLSTSEFRFDTSRRSQRNSVCAYRFEPFFVVNTNETLGRNPGFGGVSERIIYVTDPIKRDTTIYVTVTVYVQCRPQSS
jgi:hypothetical protein